MIEKKSYGQILKSSAIIGGSSAVTIVLGIIRSKALALLLGPAGVGLIGLFNSISDLVRCISGMGMNNSGVRQIAEAVGTGDTQRIACTVTTLRRVALFFSAIGALMLLIFCKPVSRLTFGDDSHAGWVALLSLAVFFGDVAAGQGALVQGMRRISDLAQISILGAIYGTVFSIPIIYFLGERGVVPSMICVALMGSLTSWWYARKIKISHVWVTLADIFREASALLKLGFIFVSSGLMTMGVAYLVRVIVIRKLGMDAAGFYQAAWVLGGLYMGFILQAMGADFYPRLTAVANNNQECNRLVNEQTEVGLLLAGPGVMATITFAPLVIRLFYSASFEPAVEVLRWICLGMVLRVACWPMGFIMISKGATKLFFVSELLCNLTYLGLAWAGIAMFGLVGTGMGFFGLYVFCWFLTFLIVQTS